MTISRIPRRRRFTGVHLPPFERLVDDHAAELHRFLAALIGSQEADDCLQETFVAALRAYGSLRNHDNLRAWLYTIAHRKALDQRRRVARRSTASLDGVDPIAPAPVPAADEELWSAVHRLPPRQRAAVIHRYVFDRPYRDVAARLGCSEQAARQSVHAGMRRLRREVPDG